MTKYKRVAPWLILATLVVWIFLTESPFQKGGVGPIFSLMVPSVVIFVSALIALFYDNFNLAERLIISSIFAIICLFVVSFYLTPYIVDFFYNDKTWLLWETKHRLFINAIYYGLNAIFLIALMQLYFSLRLQRNKANEKIAKA